MGWSVSRRSAAGLVAVIVAGGVVHAQENPEPRPRHQTAAGILTAYDPATRVLTLRNATGFSEFHVAPDARFWLGSRRLSGSQLGAHAGAQITVAWSRVDGVKTTHTVRVTDTRAARAR
jgi:hypothetical protein